MSAPALSAVLALNLLWAPAPATADKPGVLTLLADDAPYRAARPPEMIYVGTLERTPSSGKIGAGRFNPYRLTSRDGAGKAVVYELRAPSKAHLLAGRVGERVRIIGKVCPVEGDAKAAPELWPARLEALAAAVAATVPDDGILARCTWQPEAARQPGARQYVFRDGKQLAQALKLSGTSTDETATALLAQRLGVAGIDWKKHMLVCVAAGLQGPDVEKLVVTRVTVKDQTLTVSFRLEAGTGGFGFPAQTVLVERFEGPARFVKEPAEKKSP
jgi:hypothetical protein